MYIGAGIDRLWVNEEQQAYFHEGYGSCTIDHECLAYYRYERIIQDLVAYAEELFLGQPDEQDRQVAYRFFASNFEPGGTIEMAHRAWQAAASLS
jgi:spectinomycin phosphotransferase